MRNRPQQTVEPHRSEKTTAGLKVFRSVALDRGSRRSQIVLEPYLGVSRRSGTLEFSRVEIMQRMKPPFRADEVLAACYGRHASSKRAPGWRRRDNGCGPAQGGRRSPTYIISLHVTRPCRGRNRHLTTAPGFSRWGRFLCGRSSRFE